MGVGVGGSFSDYHRHQYHDNHDEGEGDVDGGSDPAPHLPRLLLLPWMHPVHGLWGGI